jgi:hypothetical protein
MPTSGHQNSDVYSYSTAPHRSKTTLISNGVFCLLESKILSIGQTLLYSLASNTNCNFKYQLLLQIPIVTLNTNCYFKYQLILQIPIVTSNTNCYFKYQLLLPIPIVTSNTNCFFKYQLLLPIPIVTSDAMSNDPPRTTKWLLEPR